MSLREEVIAALDGVQLVGLRVGLRVDRQGVLHHGEPAIRVTAYLPGGRIVEGTYSTEPVRGMGGVEGMPHKDVPALFAGKVAAVLAGTAEEVQS